MVNAITIHRDFVNSAIVRSDVFVTPVKVSFVSLSSFGFESCVLPFKGVKRRRVVYFLILYYASIYLVPIQMHKSRTMMII